MAAWIASVLVCCGHETSVGSRGNSDCRLAAVYLALHRCQPQGIFVLFLLTGIWHGGASAVPRDRSQLLWVHPAHAETCLMLLADLGGKNLDLVVGEVCLDIAQR